MCTHWAWLCVCPVILCASDSFPCGSVAWALFCSLYFFSLKLSPLKTHWQHHAIVYILYVCSMSFLVALCASWVVGNFKISKSLQQCQYTWRCDPDENIIGCTVCSTVKFAWANIYGSIACILGENIMKHNVLLFSSVHFNRKN